MFRKNEWSSKKKTETGIRYIERSHDKVGLIDRGYFSRLEDMRDSTELHTDRMGDGKAKTGFINAYYKCHHKHGG